MEQLFVSQIVIYWQKKFFQFILNVRKFCIPSFLVCFFVIFPHFLSSTESAYASFIHQLNAYGFERIKKGTNKDCYFHPFFLRDVPELMFQLYRMPSHTKNETTSERLSMFSPMFNLPALVPSSHVPSSAPPSFQSSSSSREQDQSSPPLSLSLSQSQSQSELPPKPKKQQIPLVQQIYMWILKRLHIPCPFSSWRCDFMRYSCSSLLSPAFLLFPYYLVCLSYLSRSPQLVFFTHYFFVRIVHFPLIPPSCMWVYSSFYNCFVNSFCFVKLSLLLLLFVVGFFFFFDLVVVDLILIRAAVLLNIQLLFFIYIFIFDIWDLLMDWWFFFSVVFLLVSIYFVLL